MKIFKNRNTFFNFLLVSMVLLSTQVFSAPIPKAPNPDVSSYILVDYDSGMVIAAKNPDLILPPASITKIMTSYLAFTELENKTLDLKDEVLISKNAWKTGGSKMFIEVGKKVRIDELLHGIITSSGNDASVAMAEHISGNEETFAIYMNQMAESLGMTNTNYANSTGLPDEELYTTAKDVALLSRALIKNFPKEYKLYSQKEYVFNKIKQYSRNKLLYLDNSVDGIKTGFTKKAGYCLATSAKRGSRRLISVVLGAKSPNQRTKVSKSLLEYGFRFYETHKIFSSNEELIQARVFNGDKNNISLGVIDDTYISVPRRQIKNIKKKFVIDRNLSAPVNQNEAVGYMVIELEGKTINTYKLFAMESIKEGSLYRKTLDSIYRYF